MNTRRNQDHGSVYGPYVDGVAAVLHHALDRTGYGRGATAILVASRRLSGAEDGGPMEVICGARAAYPPRMTLLELDEEETQTAMAAMNASLEDPDKERWSDLVVAVHIERRGIAVKAMPSPVSRLVDPAAAQQRRNFLGAPPLERLKALSSMSGM